MIIIKNVFFTDNLGILFDLTLTLINEQVLSRGHSKKDYISFPIQHLVDIGAYDTISSAREGFMDGLNSLTSIRTKDFNGHDKVSSIVFTGGEFENGLCIIYLNNRLNWKKMYRRLKAKKIRSIQ